MLQTPNENSNRLFNLNPLKKLIEMIMIIITMYTNINE
jgi:hypothetical protein